MLFNGRGLKVFLVAMGLLTLIGCKDPVTWSAESRSPDSKWVAYARTIEHGGFGTGGVETNVEIRRSDRAGSPQRVLSFADDGAAIRLTLRWEGPSRLVATFKGNPDLLYFQVVKTSGLQISTQNLSVTP